jgi:hypothetical protein
MFFLKNLFYIWKYCLKCSFRTLNSDIGENKEWLKNTNEELGALKVNMFEDLEELRKEVKEYNKHNSFFVFGLQEEIKQLRKELGTEKGRITTQTKEQNKELRAYRKLEKEFREHISNDLSHI